MLPSILAACGIKVYGGVQPPKLICTRRHALLALAPEKIDEDGGADRSSDEAAGHFDRREEGAPTKS